MCGALANIVRAAYAGEKLYVIGFAETATGIAASLCHYLPNVLYYQNTTREFCEGRDYLYFTESHSHATAQMLRTSGLEKRLSEVERILFVDDEVTTGNTICKLIGILKEKYQGERLRFSIVSILNSMKSERVSELLRQGVECLYLSSIPFEYRKGEILDLGYEEGRYSSFSKLKEMEGSEGRHRHDDKFICPELGEEKIIRIGGNEPICPASGSLCQNSERPKPTLIDEGRGMSEASGRFEPGTDARDAVLFSEYDRRVTDYSNELAELLREGSYGSVLVLGTEEFMYPAIRTGMMVLEKGLSGMVRVHATSRSPILASGREAYPLFHRWQLRSPYDPARITYIYNLQKYDKVLVLTDAGSVSPGIRDLCAALHESGNRDIMLVLWEPC